MKSITLLFILFFWYNSLAQTISGTITDEKGAVVYTANILFKDYAEPNVLKEFIVARNGKFSFVLSKEYKNLLIEVKTTNYQTLRKIFSNVNNDQKYDFNFILIKKDTIELEEVRVVAKRLPFEIKDDTISYSVAAYRDGSERKIQDVIRKLPGVEVNDKTGEIKYRGKSVETVTLDGDNLFGYNYSIGTKNINVDMVEQVQAIDNYSENSLLKGIEQGGKVALNLKLRKDKFDFSGSLEAGVGIFSNSRVVRREQATLLGINSKYKSFASISHNNVGINDSPFDYFGFNKNIEQQKERNFYAQKLIPETRFFSQLDDSRANINNQNFGNYNAIFRINNKLAIKTNIYGLADKVTSNQYFESQYIFNGQQFVTFDDTQLSKNPVQYRGDIELKYNLSTKSLIEYELRLRHETIQTLIGTTSNDNLSFKSTLSTDDFYQKQRFLYTNKLNKTQAFQFLILQSYNNVPQLFNLLSYNTEKSSLATMQRSNVLKQHLDVKANLLGTNRFGKYNFSFDYTINKISFRTFLENSQSVSASEIINNSIYSNQQTSTIGSYQILLGKFLVLPSYAVTFYLQNLNFYTTSKVQEKNDLVFEPAMNLRFKINEISSLTLKAGITQSPLSEQYLFINPVLVNNRTTIANSPLLELQKGKNIRLGFIQNNLYNQYQLNVGAGYRQSTGDYFSNFIINERITNISYFFLPQNNENLNTDFQVSKYVSAMASTLKFSTNFDVSTYQNIINNSELRRNRMRSLSTELFWKTAFSVPINFENIMKWQLLKAENIGTRREFVNNAVQNVSRIFIKPIDKWFVVLSSEVFVPNWLNRKENFAFFDATIRYQPKKKPLEYTATFKNITNTQNFEQVQASDLSTNIFRSNLLPRYIFAGLTYSF